MQMSDNLDISKNTSKEEVNVKIYYLLVKRVFDVLLSLIGILILSPIFIFLIILIKLDSKGPVFFSHTRLGRYGKNIKVYKFRTMVSNAEEVFNNFTEEQKKEFEINFKLDNDPRITKIGVILRKTSLDELPQLFNILSGDMSIVGPRPIVQKEVEKYGEFSDKLFSVTPGLTGYWQAHGRSDTTYEERVNMDIYYIDNRSILLDIKIILKTFVSVLRKEGAI